MTALSLGLATPAFAQTAPKSEEPTFSAAAVKAHVEFLADDLLEGRNAGTRGFDIAARYVATRFEALGLKPGGTNGGWYQQVPLAEFSLDPAAPASITVGGKKFANGEDVLIGASPRYGSTAQVLTGNVVFAGFGLNDDYAGLDVKDKFVAVLLGTPRGLTGAAAEAAGAEDKGANAGKRGALGVIYLVSPENLQRMSWASARGYFLRSQMTWLGPNGAPGGEDPGIKIGAYTNPAVAAALFAGSPQTAEQVFAAVTAGERPKGFALTPKVTTERTSKVKIVNSPNVIGILPGSDPRLSAEYVVLSAHLDHDGVDPNLPGPDKTYNGAMDNAAGVATMLEVARAFAESGKRPKRSILFVALTAEEDGLLGSEYLAKYPVVGSGKVVADVNLDMPILLYDFTDVVAFGAEHSTLGPIVERAGARMGVTLSPDPMPEENLFVRSDHYSFVKAGVPSVFLVTGWANGGKEAFQKFLATDYHKVTDQTNLPFNWEAGAKFAKINYLIAAEIANAPEAPRWYEGNKYGDQYAPGQPRAPRPAPKPAAAPAKK
ncbi:M20/M25/M40 family metallo-hydrolase [Sphingomonas sp. AOB5]|uniref:M20/M25/M40 family metallo-hydrolase n=1 Tax=Sphingomonas sp. AOB5 TaxID=3034017 RepID=UPI0023F6CA16|nr:M20/M25/M40 family metallo-hydrolase [Sphingomonas sp. AOB5]MDF7775101.1 M20/M25/M40 family metallo-hydrolase [Sphingomonas sp. AOB5]